MVSTLWLAAARIWNHFHIWPRGACVFVRTYGLELRILEKIHLLQQLWEPWGFHWRKKQFFCSSMRFQCFDCSNARRISDMFFSCYFFFFLQDITFHWVSLSEEMSTQHSQNSRNTSCGVGNRRHRPFKFQDVIVSNNLLYHSIFFFEWMEILKLIPDWLFGVCVVLVCHPGSAWNWKFWNKSARTI